MVTWYPGKGGAAEGSSAAPADAGNDDQGADAPPPPPAKADGSAGPAAGGTEESLALDMVAVSTPVVQRSAPHLLLAQFPAEFSQLVADMCLDRGLDDTARQQLRELLTFDDVLAVMSSPTEPLRKRAGYCEVMRCLHVDTAPQIPMAVFRSRVNSLGGAIYPAPGASSRSLHILLHTVQHILLRGSDFQTGSATFGTVGAWRRWVCVRGRRGVGEGLVQTHCEGRHRNFTQKVRRTPNTTPLIPLPCAERSCETVLCA